MDLDIAFAGAEPAASLAEPASPSSGFAGSAVVSRRPRPAVGEAVVDLRRADAAALADALDGLATSVFLVNARGFPVHVNAGGRAMLAARNPLRLAHGELAGATDAADRVLRRVLAGALGDRPGGSGESLALAGKGGSHFIAHATPLGARARRAVEPGAAPVAALFIRAARIDLGAAIETATQVYDFTPGEARVLRAMIEIGGIPAVAAALGLSRPTVKTHLAQLFEKTGCRRQAELVSLIAGFDSPGRNGRRDCGLRR